MTIGDAGPCFIDTNVLVYASVPQAPLYQWAVLALRALMAAQAPLWIRRQIIREFLATMSRPETFGGPVAPAMLVTQAQAFEQRYVVAEDSPAVIRLLL